MPVGDFPSGHRAGVRPRGWTHDVRTRLAGTRHEKTARREETGR
ncbi:MULTISPECIES: hypothetical protein [unclassified Streptomyces]